MMTNVDHLKVEGMKPLICKKDQIKTPYKSGVLRQSQNNV